MLLYVATIPENFGRDRMTITSNNLGRLKAAHWHFERILKYIAIEMK